MKGGPRTTGKSEGKTSSITPPSAAKQQGVGSSGAPTASPPSWLPPARLPPGLAVTPGKPRPLSLPPGSLALTWERELRARRSHLSCSLPAKRPVSPYSGYNGQLLTSVYQPTEMTLMHKGPVSGVPESRGPCGPCRVRYGSGERAGVSTWCISLGTRALAPGAPFLEALCPMPSVICGGTCPPRVVGA